MTKPPVNIHGTAIVIGTTGLLFTGSSGSGKSSTAHACLTAADAWGLFARLVADDQVFVEMHHGRIVASRPPAIAGLMEIRGTGLAVLPTLRRTVLHYEIAVGLSSEMERLPEPEERRDFFGGIGLPLIRLARETPDPLGVLARFIPFSPSRR